jgi:predicted amidohydrolase
MTRESRRNRDRSGVCYLLLLALLAAGCHPAPLSTADGPLAPPAAGQVRVAGIVLKWLAGDKAGNFQRLEPLVREAAANGARIVVTTESALDGYAVRDKGMDLATYRSLGEGIPDGPFYQRAAALARELGIYLVLGLTEAEGELRYNTAVVIGPDGKPVGRYRKQAIGFEAGRNAPGSGHPVFATPYGRLGVMICNDRRQPAIARQLRGNGADLLIIPSGGMFGRRNDRIVGDRSRENGVPSVFVHPAEFLVTAPDGSIKARALLGDQLAVEPGERDGRQDRRAVFYVDLPMERALPGH